MVNSRNVSLSRGNGLNQGYLAMDSATREQPKKSPLGDVSHTGFSLASIKVQEGTVEELEYILQQRIDTTHGAYHNSAVVLNIEDVGNLNAFDFVKLQDVCRAHDLFLLGVSGVVNEDRAESLVRRRIPVVNSNRYARVREENLKPKIVTQLLELKVPVAVPVPYEIKVPYEVKTPSPVRIIKRNVRSGETVHGQNSSIAIYGSLSPHARIIAAHHVFVFGNVNSADIFAGSPHDTNDPGRPDALIHVQGDFIPGVIAIAGNYRTAEDLDNDPLLTQVCQKKNGVIVTLEDNNLHYYTVSSYAGRT